MTNKSEETNVLISLLNDPPLSPSWFRSHFLLHIIRNSIIFWWLLSKAILLPKVQLPVVKTTSSSIEGASISTVDLTRSETPAPTLQAPSISSSECSLQCCTLNSPTPTRLDVDKESSARSYGKRKRYFQPEWLQKYDWLVLCKTESRAYCHSCRYVLSANLQTAQKNGVDSFTSKGFNNWKNGSVCLSRFGA